MTFNSAAQQPSLWPVLLETPRLVLRPVTADDLPAIERLWRDERVRRFLGGPVAEEQIVVRRRGLANMPGAFAVPERETGTVLGLVTIDTGSPRGATEVSYTLLTEHRGRGAGREAVAAAMEWVDGLPGTDRGLIAVTQAANTASRRLLEAVGMRWSGEVMEYGELQAVYTTQGRTH